MAKNKNNTGNIIEYREIHAIVHVPDRWEEDGPISTFEQTCKENGFEVEAAEIMDYDDADEQVRERRNNIRRNLGIDDDNFTPPLNMWDKYCLYLIQWANDHRDAKYKGMSPACYDEWSDWEGEEDDEWS